MRRLKSEEYIFYQGDKFQVEFYYTNKSNTPAKEFLESLENNKVLIKLAGLVKLIAEEGKIYDEKKFRIVNRKEKIYEFKPSGFRFFNFFMRDKKIIITNGYAKKTQKIDKAALNKAIKYKKDYIDRVSGGGYYG